jgi:hypothetical protein
VHPLALPPFCCLPTHLRLRLRPFALHPFCCLHLHLRPVASALASASVCTCDRVRLPCVRLSVLLQLRPFGCLASVCVASVWLPCVRLRCVRLAALRPFALRPIYCLRLHLRPVASVWLPCVPLAACVQLPPGACTCVRLPCVRFAACVLLRLHLHPVACCLLPMALVALVGPAQKTNIATKHPPYPFVLLAFYL